jgi:RimJ/RimL family protein N-acetyltransferase
MYKSNHVYLSPIRNEDLPTLWNWINDRTQVLMNSWYKPVTEIQHQQWFTSIQNADDFYIFGIRLLESDQLIGSCQLHSINFIDRNAELQIRLGDVSNRGHGYGTESLQLLLQFAFMDLNLIRVYLNVLSTNQVALRVYEKVGFKTEGVLRKAAHIDGKYVDLVVMGILQEEFNSGNQL